jgi:putative ABC transport system substrate-binding protein
VAMGLAVSEAHPGANVTGTLIRLTGLTGKQLEVGLDLVPRATMVGVLANLGSQANVFQQQEAESAAAKLGVTLAIVDARTEADIGPAFKKFTDERVNIILVLNDVMLLKLRRLISALALVARLPTVFYLRENVEDGGLVSYGVDLRENYRRAGFYVDKILKGEKAADLPIEFLPKLELVINLATAKALGLTIPNKLLATADEVIE